MMEPGYASAPVKPRTNTDVDQTHMDTAYLLPTCTRRDEGDRASVKDRVN